MRKMIFCIITKEEERLPFYVTSIGANENQYHVQRPEGYPNYHFLYCTAGQGRLLIDGKEYFIGEQSGFFFYPGVAHEYYAEAEPWTTWWITFDGYAVKELLEVIGMDQYTVFHISDLEKLHRLHGEVHAVAASARPARGYDASHMLYRFLLESRSCIGEETLKARHGRYQQLQPLLQFIEENYNKEITLNDMAEITGVTPQHLCRLFKQTLNMRPFEYLTRHRLQKAKEILAGPGNSVLKEVADITGYHDTSYFCSVFRQYEGMTPVEFKRMHRE
jgi:AraC family transcriptional regulator, arabinose operon regulatory protein